ncbi:unnamed protein product [Polarella glacialis]|uniref:Signal peptidase II n=1 Tax=Polarella glacialis TaxID=89957 RepID=A0A813I552_POLGL|nr:unnamed protein product [Polarella glacialis]
MADCACDPCEEAAASSLVDSPAHFVRRRPEEHGKEKISSSPCEKPHTWRWRLAWGLLIGSLPVELLLKYTAWRFRRQLLLLDIPALSLRLEWTYSENHRSALGFLQAASVELRRGIYAACALLTLAASVWVAKPGRCSAPTRFGAACYVVGGFGNLIDRALISCVVDYVMFTAVFEHWRIYFNLSDLILNLGFGVLFYQLWTSGADATHQE